MALSGSRGPQPAAQCASQRCRRARRAKESWLAREPRKGCSLSSRGRKTRRSNHAPSQGSLQIANRCGASLATIMAMLRHRPDAKIVWFDAHGDFNTPETTPTGYLGGMVLSALCGLWDSGLDAGLSPDRVILAGTRDVDPGESRLIAAHGVRVIAAKDGAVDVDRSDRRRANLASHRHRCGRPTLSPRRI
jgi:arginase family protein